MSDLREAVARALEQADLAGESDLGAADEALAVVRDRLLSDEVRDKVAADWGDSRGDLRGTLRSAWDAINGQ